MSIPEPARTIIEAALQAPSGENSQPWLFQIGDYAIELFHDTQSDTSLYNYENRGSLVAHGAAIENMCISAASLGLTAEVLLFPDTKNPTHIATLRFSPAVPDSESKRLSAAIFERTSNRKPYKKEMLAHEHVDALESAALPFASQGLRYHRVTDPEHIKALGVVAATNEEVMLQNKQLHQFFFSHLLWTKEEDEQKKVGFYIKTLELPPPVQALFRLIRHWSIMSLFIRMGFPKMVRVTNAKNDAAAGEFGIITAKNDTPEALVYTGRMVQRIWLTATTHRLQMQLMTGTLFLYHTTQKNPDAFSVHELQLLETQMEKLYSMLEKKRDVAVCMFRVGYGERASARALRYTPEERLV
jgi:hypothetical protein